MDLIDVLRASSEDESSDGVMITAEILKATGWSKNRVEKSINEKLDAGEIEVIFVRRKNRVGYWHTVPGYKVKVDEQASA